MKQKKRNKNVIDEGDLSIHVCMERRIKAEGQWRIYIRFN